MAQRTGFGVMKGLTGNYRQSTQKEVEPKILPDRPAEDRVVSRRKIESDWEAVGAECMRLLETEGAESAIIFLEKARQEKRIFGNELRKLTTIVNHIKETI
jgi:hypothetical protein